MSEIPRNVRQVLLTLVPAAVINDIACFVFYDNHPRDDKTIDITIFTKSGELREYYQRNLLSSTRVDGLSNATELRSLRNNEGELFYLLSAEDELIILSGKENLRIHQRVNNIERFEVNDSTCSGHGCLKIVNKDDAVPLIFDDNFENLRTPEMSEIYTTEYLEDDCLPLVTHLKRKLTEAKYSVKCNEKIYKEFLGLRQMSAFSMYKEIHPNLDDSVIEGGLKTMASALKLKFQTPFVKVCNKMLIIVFIVINENIEPLQDIHILLHGTTKPSLVYTTKLFGKTNTPPFWKANKTQTICYNIETAAVVVMDMKEMKHNVCSKIEFNGVIFYTKAGKECLLPIEKVTVSAMDTMGKGFDVLSSDEIDSNTMLAILSVAEKTDLILRHIKKNEDPSILGMDMFCRYLDMTPLPGSDIVIHRSSPYHVLNGVMIIKRNKQGCHENSLIVSVHSRSPSQVLALIHYIHDAIPLTIIATTTNYTITSKDSHLSEHNKETQQSMSYKYQNYAQSMLDRNTTVLEYLDNSMIKMNECKNPAVQRKIGTEIDLLAEGIEKYSEFRNKMLDKASEGMKMMFDDNSCDIETDTMVTD